MDKMVDGASQCKSHSLLNARDIHTNGWGLDCDMVLAFLPILTKPCPVNATDAKENKVQTMQLVIEGEKNAILKQFYFKINELLSRKERKS